MYELTKIYLGKDEAENDARLKEYFLKTEAYIKASNGDKTIIIGRKGSGKSAIFTLMKDDLKNHDDNVVITITPDQYSWQSLKDYREQGITELQAYTNAWKLTLFAVVIWRLNELGLISRTSPLRKFIETIQASYVPEKSSWFNYIINNIKKELKRVKAVETPVGGIEVHEQSTITPLVVTERMKALLEREWSPGKKVRILIDRLDDSWDASDESKNLIIGLLKAANEINGALSEKCIVTVFIRSDIYDALFFGDKDKLRQYEERISWENDDLVSVVTERVKVSLGLNPTTPSQKIWDILFSARLYRSKAKADKYIIDRTFKRPRDIISFVRSSLELAAKEGHLQIEPEDVRLTEEHTYSRSKYEDLIIEYRDQYPFIKELMDRFTGSQHKLSYDEIIGLLQDFSKQSQTSLSPTGLLKLLFNIGFIGVKRQGRAGVKQRGGQQFYHYYEDPSINPLLYHEFYIHRAFRHYLNVSEKRETKDEEIAEEITE